jgi:hypothetical protein
MVLEGNMVILGDGKGPRRWMLLAAASVLLMAAFACTLDLNSAEETPDETEISRSVNETLSAEQVLTNQAPQDEASAVPPAGATENSAAQQTIQAQQATLDAQATLVTLPSQISPPAQDTPSPTGPTPASLEPISLTDWEPINLRQAPGCGQDHSGPPCWFGTAENLSITLKKPILIDPAWPSPYLVFTHKYVFIHNATIYANAGGSWEILWSFPAGQSILRVPHQVDLSKYKGKEILLQFSSTGASTTASGKVRMNTWEIRDPQIVPDFSNY